MSQSTQERINIDANVRTVFGKQVRSLRKTGIVPANIYGKGFEPKAIQLDKLEFFNAYKRAGETTVVYVTVDGATIPTLISDIQIDPLSRQILHADMRKVDLKKKIEANVPIMIVGKSEAVEHKNGVLLTQNDHITVEALPTHIPHDIEVDISALAEIGDEITVAQLATSGDYTITDEPTMVVVSVTEHVEETVEVQTTSEAPEILTEKEGDEGAAAAAPEGSVKEVHKKND